MYLKYISSNISKNLTLKTICTADYEISIIHIYP